MSPDFAKYWIGQTVSNLGSSFTAFALPLLVYELTHSPVYLAATTASYFVPYLLFGLVIGAWVDRVDRWAGERFKVTPKRLARPLISIIVLTVQSLFTEMDALTGGAAFR